MFQSEQIFTRYLNLLLAAVCICANYVTDLFGVKECGLMFECVGKYQIFVTMWFTTVEWNLKSGNIVLIVGRSIIIKQFIKK